LRQHVSLSHEHSKSRRSSAGKLGVSSATGVRKKVASAAARSTRQARTQLERNE
jgi:hypothetical protein